MAEQIRQDINNGKAKTPVRLEFKGRDHRYYEELATIKNALPEFSVIDRKPFILIDKP